ncbi:methyltransferase domain-containing protein [Cohnella cellulosilytica]|uniref:Methyltransferase domain-containing protein n=1 Tax=Cohnella cellulosilytica TaxID=986710 RepID=A0ABW2F9W7_9BACL
MTTSIIMATYNQLAMTKRAIASIRKHTPASSYELIVVDNASSDGTAEWLAQQPDVKLLRQPKNVGFPAACNIGAAAAEGDCLLLLNNDTVVTPRWLEQLTRALDSDERVGAVGPITNYAGYGQMIETSYRTMDEMQRFADAYNVSSPGRWEERMKLIGFCLMIKRTAWEAAGPLDESYGIGNYEDDDWCVSARLAGFRLLLCRDTFIHHEGSASFRHVKETYRKAMLENEKTFMRKWGFHPQISVNVRDDLLRPLRALKPGMSVLEVGCGCGATLLELRNRYGNVRLFGCENEASAAKIAGLVAEKVWTNDEEIEIPSGTKGFDAVVLNDMLSDPARLPVLQRIHRLLRPGGIVTASAPNRLFVDYVKAYLKPLNPVPRDAMLSRSEFERRLRQAGFGDIAIEPIAAEEAAKREIDALCQLAGEAGRDEYAAIYYVASAVKETAGERTAFGKIGGKVGKTAGAASPVGAAPGGEPASQPPVNEAAANYTEATVNDLSYLPKAQEDVPFTGERLILSSAVAGSHPDVLAEHVYRYRLARGHCVGRQVLDAACGAGFGARMLKDGGASSVTGVDIDAAAVALAGRDYGGEGVSFQVGNVLQLAFANAVFDVVVSFETIEHVPDGAAWLREAARVLRPGGRLIISTPNRDVTNPDRQFGQQVRNPYHIFEYSLAEFIGELSVLYDIEGVFGQTFVGPHGHVAPEWPDIAAAVGGDTEMAGFNPDIIRFYGPASLSRVKNARPAYAIAVCRKR